jgi:hypothetical protein
MDDYVVFGIRIRFQIFGFAVNFVLYFSRNMNWTSRVVHQQGMAAAEDCASKIFACVKNWPQIYGIRPRVLRQNDTSLIK